jgi:copper transport protein
MTISKSNLRRILAVMIALLVVMSSASLAFAHAQLVRSDPADDSSLPQAPHEISLWFSEPIVLQFSSVRLVDGKARDVLAQGLRSSPTDPNLIVLALNNDTPLPNDVYTVIWKVLSADGHYTTGHSVFSVGAAADMKAVTGDEGTQPIPAVEVALRWLNYSLLAMVAGGLFIAYLVVRPARQNAIERETTPLATALQQVERRITGWVALCGISAIGVGFAWLAWQVNVLGNTGTQGGTTAAILEQLLGQTQWGGLWLVRQGLLIALSVAIVIGIQVRKTQGGSTARPERPSALNAVTLVMSLAVLFVQALTGHAASLQTDSALAIVADTAHLIAVGVWIGGLIGLSVGLLGRASQATAGMNRGMLLKATWTRFSLLAAISVGMIVVSGVYSTGRQVASLDALITTVYGQAIIVKVGLLLLAGAVGLVNSMLLNPGVAAPLARLLRRPQGWTPLSINYLPALALGELSLGLVIFAAASVLTAAPPAHGPEFAPAPEFNITSASRIANDMLISFSAKPNLPGQNVMNIVATSTRRPAPAEVLRVIVRMIYLEKDIGAIIADAQKVEPDHYLLGGNYLSLAGSWQIQVVVRRMGLEDAVASFDWYVPPASPRLVVISNQPWESALTTLAFVLLFGLASVLMGQWAANRSRRAITASLKRTTALNSTPYGSDDA